MTAMVMTLLLDRELQKINRVIDLKIQKKESYRKEARLHLRIVNKLNRLHKQKSVLAVL